VVVAVVVQPCQRELVEELSSRGFRRLHACRGAGSEEDKGELLVGLEKGCLSTKRACGWSMEGY
jgi:hypothetical protein